MIEERQRILDVIQVLKAKKKEYDLLVRQLTSQYRPDEIDHQVDLLREYRRMREDKSEFNDAIESQIDVLLDNKKKYEKEMAEYKDFYQPERLIGMIGARTAQLTTDYSYLYAFAVKTVSIFNRMDKRDNTVGFNSLVDYLKKNGIDIYNNYEEDEDIISEKDFFNFVLIDNTVFFINKNQNLVAVMYFAHGANEISKEEIGVISEDLEVIELVSTFMHAVINSRFIDSDVFKDAVKRSNLSILDKDKFDKIKEEEVWVTFLDNHFILMDDNNKLLIINKDYSDVKAVVKDVCNGIQVWSEVSPDSVPRNKVKVKIKN